MLAAAVAKDAADARHPFQSDNLPFLRLKPRAI